MSELVIRACSRCPPSAGDDADSGADYRADYGSDRRNDAADHGAFSRACETTHRDGVARMRLSALICADSNLSRPSQAVECLSGSADWRFTASDIELT